MTTPIALSAKPARLNLLICLLLAGLSGCELQQQPRFLTTPAQARALDRILAAVRVDLRAYRVEHSGVDLATAEEFLGQRDLLIRLILNDEQWNTYLAEQKTWWARSLQKEFRQLPLKTSPTTRPPEIEAPDS